MEQDVRITMPALSENEGLARSVAGAFAARMDPTLEELEDVRLAVSEAVTNAIVHGYEGLEPGPVELVLRAEGRQLQVEVRDYGRGIADIGKARQPFYTTRPELERSGMGFTVMESFMDTVDVLSSPGDGTTVILKKVMGRDAGI